jgi:hypothetical protein
MFGVMFAFGGSPVFGLVGGTVFGYFYLVGDRRKVPARRAPLQWRHLLRRNSLTPGLVYALIGGGVYAV